MSLFGDSAFSVWDVLEGLQGLAADAVNYDFHVQQAEYFTDFYGLPVEELPGERGAFAHAYLSAVLTRDYGSTIAETYGNAREFSTTMQFYVGLGEDYRTDTFRDLFNNHVGILIGQYAADHSLTDEQIAELVYDALYDGDLLVSINVNDPDPRVPDISHLNVWASGYPPAYIAEFMDGDFNGWPQDFGEFEHLVQWTPPTGPQGSLDIPQPTDTAIIEFGHGNYIVIGSSETAAVIGSSGNDIIQGTDDANVMQGGDGVDVLSGLGGNDTLSGEAGDDFLSGSSGADVLNGGAGWDVADYTGSDAGVVIDLTQESSEWTGDAQGDSLEGIEEIRGSEHDDTLIGTAGFDALSGGDGNDQLYTALPYANLESPYVFLRDEDDRPVDYGGEDILRGGNGFDAYYINSLINYYPILIPGGGVDMMEINLTPATIISDSDGLGQIRLNGRILDAVGDTIHTDWFSGPLPVSAEMVGNDLVIRLPYSPIFGGNLYTGEREPIALGDWNFSSYFGGTVPEQFEGIDANTIVIRNYVTGDLGFYFDGGLHERPETEELRVGGGALGFTTEDPYGLAYDEGDGSASFNAYLEDVTFSFDGRDIWIHIEENEYETVHIRGHFENGEFVRAGGLTTLETLNFLDGSWSIEDLTDELAADIAATVGTSGNDTLVGRDHADDIFNRGAGLDTIIITPDSGSDRILRDGITQGTPELLEPDTIHFDGFEDKYVFMREGPAADLNYYDARIEFIEQVTDGQGTRFYLSEQTLIIEDWGYDPVLSDSTVGDPRGAYSFTFEGDPDGYVHSYDVYEIEYSRSEVTLERGGEDHQDLIIQTGGETIIIPDQFIDVLEDDRPTFEDIGMLLFEDGELLTREMLAALLPIEMTSVNPEATGTGFGEIIVGSEVADTINAGLGDDTIEGGLGDDALRGDRDFTNEDVPYVDGNDTYIYSEGDGNDLIWDEEIDGSGTDTLRLLDLNPEDVVLVRFTINPDYWGFGYNTEPYTGEHNSLLIINRATGERIEILDQFLEGSTGIEQIEFANNVVWDRGDIEDAVENVDPTFDAAPIARRDWVGEYEVNGTFDIPVAALITNDADVEGDSLEIVSVQGAVGGTVQLVDGVVTFVRSSNFAGVASFTYTVSDGVNSTNQIVELGPIVMGTAGDDSLVGSEDAEPFFGLDGNDSLFGGGSDTLIGGAGNDVYYIGGGNDLVNIGYLDEVVEGADEGIDTAIGFSDTVEEYAWAIFAAPNVENVTLLGSGNLAGFGNELDNVIAGSEGNNDLGGWLGNDTLVGGEGSDGYYYYAGDGDDIFIDTGSTSDTDTLHLYGELQASDLAFARSGDDLIITILGADEIVIQDQFTGDGIEEIQFEDDPTLSRATFEALV